MLSLEYPIIQAPMAGGATTPELVAAVSNNGCLGSFAAGYLPPDEIKSAIKRIRELTAKPFAVNLFIPEAHETTHERMQRACEAINGCASEIGLSIAPVDGPYAPSFEEQLTVLIEERISAVSFTFGIPESALINTLKSNQILVMATATTLAEAYALYECGVDVIVAQGSEAGGHRGSFMERAEDCLIPIHTLVQQITAEISLPVIASGGIMNGAAIVKAIKSGASAAQLGTAFLCCKESGIADSYKRLLLSQTNDITVLTRAFSGKLARGINNKFIQCMAGKADSILDYPIQNKLTNIMRTKAKQDNNTDYMSLWAGQFAYLARELDAKSLIAKLVKEMG